MFIHYRFFEVVLEYKELAYKLEKKFFCYFFSVFV